MYVMLFVNEIKQLIKNNNNSSFGGIVTEGPFFSL